ncbi:uncharacterized protein, partial [Spinacia oleracea]|uniref:Uncharacterized protein n=1 Tax=Spinacia oleracea TaxID=3562 RepID=A0ABM3QPT2_SPIOL
MEAQNESENEDGYVRHRHSNTEGVISSSSVSSASDIKSALTDFSFDDMYQIDKSNKSSFAIDNEQCDAPQTLPDDDGDPLQTVPDDDDDDASVCCQSPPVQVMERPAAAAAETSAYRIPSYVFATTKTSHPEWSTTSNESLFSIHTGNMSFTRDQFSWLLKSGELGIYGGPADIRKSGELPPPSPVHVRKSEEQQRGAVNIQTQERIPSSSRKTGEEIIAAHFKTLSTTSRTSYDKETDSQGT